MCMGDKNDVVECLAELLNMVPADLSDSDQIPPDIIQEMRDHVNFTLSRL